MSLIEPSDAKPAVREPHFVLRYGLAVLLFGAVLGLSVLLDRFGIKISLTVPIVAALFVTAWYGGFGPGILISALFHGTTILYTKVPPESSPAKVIFGSLSIFSVYIVLVYVISRLKKNAGETKAAPRPAAGHTFQHRRRRYIDGCIGQDNVPESGRGEAHRAFER